MLLLERQIIASSNKQVTKGRCWYAVAGPAWAMNSPGSARLALPLLPGTVTPSTASPRNTSRAAAGAVCNGSTGGGGTCANGSTTGSVQRPAATAVAAAASASTDAAVQRNSIEQSGMFGVMKDWAHGTVCKA